MNRLWVGIAVIGWGCAGVVMGQLVELGGPAPAPVLMTASGDSYKFMSELYHEGEERGRDRRSAVALCFIGQEATEGAEALPKFMAVASKVQGHPVLRGKVRFYVVGTDPLSEKDRLAMFLARNGVRPPVLTLLDPQRRACAEFGVEEMPRTFVISKHGTLVADIEGAGSGYAKALATGIVRASKDAGGARRGTTRAAGMAPAEAGRGGASQEESDPDQPMGW